MSQTERIKAMLRAGPVCSYADVPLWLPNFRSRVSDLRNQGWTIDAPWCQRDHDPPRGAHKEYVAADWPDRPPTVEDMQAYEGRQGALYP